MIRENRMPVDECCPKCGHILNELNPPVYYMPQLPFPEGGEEWHNDSTPMTEYSRWDGFTGGVIIASLVFLILLTLAAIGAWH